MVFITLSFLCKDHDDEEEILFWAIYSFASKKIKKNALKILKCCQSSAIKNYFFIKYSS